MKNYFAYGADLNGEEFEKLCPSLKKIASACLDNWEFFVDEFGTTNIKASEERFVWGGVWQISDKDFEKLKSVYSSEMIELSVRIEKIFSDKETSRETKVFTKVGKSQKGGICTDCTLQDLFYGGLDFKLPEDYLEFTQRFYANNVFIHSELLRGYENDYIADKLAITPVGVGETCETYVREKSGKEILLKNIPYGKHRTKGIIYKLNDMKALVFFDGIFANRKFFRRYPIRIKTSDGEIILAWCYFKEETLNLGILEVME